MNLIRANVTGNLGMLLAWLFITGNNDQDLKCGNFVMNVQVVLITVGRVPESLSTTSQHDTHFEPWLRYHKIF